LLNDPEDSESYGLWIGSNKDDLNTSYILYAQQFWALLIKRMINTVRNKVLIISQLIIPIAILIINLVYLKYAPIKNEDSPSLQINIEQYGKNFVPFNLINTSDHLTNDLSKIYLNQINHTKNTQVFNLNDNKTVSLCLEHRDNIDHFLSCMGNIDVYYVVDGYLIASTFSNLNENLSIIAHFNDQVYHAVPLTLNLINNALFKLYTSINNSITVFNHPLPRTVEDEATDLQFKAITGTCFVLYLIKIILL
jgi:hypothetical protein